MGPLRAILTWAALIAAVGVPLLVAAGSPLLQWRDPVYIGAGFAGIVAMALLLVQPLLIGGYLPGLPRRHGRHVHRWTGALLIGAAVLHVAGLWLTSPPDMIDALLFASPTPFSVWGVMAMWAVFAAGALAALRSRFRHRYQNWRLGHSALVTAAVLGSTLHALLIEGTMGMASKALLCALAVAAVAKALFDLRAWASLKKSR